MALTCPSTNRDRAPGQAKGVVVLGPAVVGLDACRMRVRWAATVCPVPPLPSHPGPRPCAAGGLFPWIACPHYFFELIEWFGFALVYRHPLAFCLALQMTGYLSGRATATVNWSLPLPDPTSSVSVVWGGGGGWGGLGCGVPVQQRKVLHI